MTHEQERQYVQACERLERLQWERDVVEGQVREAEEDLNCLRCGEPESEHTGANDCPPPDEWSGKLKLSETDEEVEDRELALQLRRQAAIAEWELAGRCAVHGEVLRDDGTCLACEAELADEQRNDL